jgi:hypothetical protein
MSSFNFGDHANSTFNYALANHNCGVEVAVSGELYKEIKKVCCGRPSDSGMVYRVPSHAGSSIEI